MAGFVGDGEEGRWGAAGTRDAEGFFVEVSSAVGESAEGVEAAVEFEDAGVVGGCLPDLAADLSW